MSFNEAPHFSGGRRRSTAPQQGEDPDEEKEQLRFFAPSKAKRSGTSKEDDEVLEKARRRNTTAPENEYYNEEDNNNEDEEDEGGGRCLTLRVLQKALPCFKKKSIWEASQGDVSKTQEVEETKYPRILKILESKTLDIIFVGACLTSIFLFFFSEGFLIESKIMWGIIHFINAVYTLCLFGQWLQILIKTRYSKTNRGYTKMDVVFTLLCIFPIDLIVLAIYTLTDSTNTTDIDESEKGETDHSMMELEDATEHERKFLIYITLSRLSYLLRIFNVIKYFSNWENQLAVGDFFMFIIRIGFYIVFFIHTLACIWHRIACDPFHLEHFKMTPTEATAEVCRDKSWILILLEENSPILDHPTWNVLLTHYLASLYWAVTTSFRLGYGDIKIYLTSDAEVIFTSMAQISAWILTMATVSGTLTSLLIESDTERENFLTRRAAVKYFLNFGCVAKTLAQEVTNYYDHLWLRRKGILHLNLIDNMPMALRSEVFYDINRDVFEQMPLLKDLDEAFTMHLSVYMSHTFYLEGEILFRRNEIGNCMYYVLKGYLEVMSVDDTQPITNIQSQSILGEVFLVHSYPHGATVRCGSDCELVVLTKQKFKQVVALYPQYEEVLQRRIEARIEDSNFFLNLCDKHNEYVQAFTKLHQYRKLVDIKGEPPAAPLIELPAMEDDGNNVGGRLATEGDFDELSFAPDVLRRLTLAVSAEKDKARQSTHKHWKRSNLEEAAFSALEADVNRAGTLAKDLGISIPPLVVSAPIGSRRRDRTTVVVTGQTVVENGALKFSKSIRGAAGTAKYFIWKSVIATCVLVSIWYYLSEWAFHHDSTRKWNYVAHIMDVLIAIDFCFDMAQIVVLSTHHTLHTARDILAYRLCTCEFYLRLFGFLPWEYIISAVFSLGSTFYLFKLNRCLELIVVARYFQSIEGVARIPIFIFLIKFTAISLYVIHFFAVIYAVIKRDVLHDPANSYIDALYWSAQVITSTGFGDLLYTRDEEIWTLTIGLIIGTAVLTFLGAKIAAILANSERRRVTFQQKYYAVMRFMNQRHFPRELAARVKRYYDIQWMAHEGVLIPTERSAIWDAPETLTDRVALGQSENFMANSLLLKYTPLIRQKNFSKALKQYFVPPGEIIMYPQDRRRELYIIAKGFCEVFSQDTSIGTLTEGHMFGLYGLIHGKNLNYLIKTQTHCQFLCLLFDDFVGLARENPAVMREFKLLRGEIEMNAKFGLKLDLSTTQHESAVSKAQSEPQEDAKVESEHGPDKGQGEGHGDSRAPAPIKPQRSSKFTTFKPYSPGLRIWVTVRTLSAILVTVYVTAQACFAFNPLLSLCMTFAFDLIAWIDIFVMFKEAYYGEHSQLIQDSKLAKLNYLKGTFIIDLLACIPFEYGVLFGTGSWDIFDLSMDHVEYGGSKIYFVMSFIRLTRAAQCYRLFGAGNYLERNIFRSLSSITLLEVVPMMFLFIHGMACIAVLIICNWSKSGVIPLECESSSWLRHFKPLNPIVNATVNQSEWLPKPDYDLNPYTMYTIAIYWVTQASVNVGFSDVQIEDKSKGIAIFIILSGCIFSQYLGSKLTACLVGEDSRRILLRHQMSVMFNFLTQFKVHKSIQRRVEQMYYNAWDKTKGVSPSDLFIALHPALQADVMNQLYEKKLRMSPLLKDLDDSGIRMLSSRLTEVFYPEGEFVIRFGDLNDDVFIISTGVITAYNSHEILMGEISALFEVPRLYSIKAASDVEAFVLRRSHFMDFLSSYPEIKSQLEMACFIHLKESMIHTKSTGLNLPSVLQGGEFDSGPVHRWNFSKDIASSTTAGGKSISADDINTLLRESLQARQESSVLVKAESQQNKEQELENFSEDAISPVDVEEGRGQALKLLHVGVEKTNSGLGEGIGHKSNKRQDWFCMPCLISFGSRPKQEMKLIHIVQERKNITLRNFAVHPASPICSSSICACLFLLITCASCSIVSFELAFTLDDGNQTEIYTLDIVRWILETFFILRFIGTFIMAYYDDSSDGGGLVSDVPSIVRRYTTRRYGLIFLFDVITVVPIAELVRIAMGAGNTTAALVAHVRSVKLLRIVLFVKYLNDAESDLRMKASNVKIVKISIIFCFIFHFCACAWYVVACYGSECTQGSWVDRTAATLQYGEPKLIQNRENITIGMWYFFSLFYVTTAVTFTGLGNIEPSTLVEVWATIFIIFATIFIIGYLVGEMTQCLASQVNHKIHYQHKLVVLETHFSNLGLPASRCHIIHEYYKMLYQKCKGMSYYRLLQDLPYSLRADIGYEIFGPNIKSSRLLHRIDEHIVRQICARIKFEVYLPGIHIVHNGDVCEAMYFIKRGEIVIIEQTQNLELCVEILYENECFGEVKLLLPQEQYHFSYVSRLESEVGVLSRKDLDEVLSNYPTLQKDLAEKAWRIKHHRISVKAEEERVIRRSIVGNDDATTTLMSPSKNE